MFRLRDTCDMMLAVGINMDQAVSCGRVVVADNRALCQAQRFRVQRQGHRIRVRVRIRVGLR